MNHTLNYTQKYVENVLQSKRKYDSKLQSKLVLDRFYFSHEHFFSFSASVYWVCKSKRLSFDRSAKIGTWDSAKINNQHCREENTRMLL